MIQTIQKFIAGLTSNQKQLLLIAGVLVGAALFDRLLIGPTVSRLSDIDQDIIKEKGVIKQDLHFLGYKDRIVKESEALEVYLTKDVATEEEMLSAFLKNVEDLASQAKIVVGKISPVAGQQEKEYLKYQADLECSGKFSDVISFMHLIDASPDLMKVTKFTLGAKKGEGDDIVKATMSIEKIVVASKPAEVKAVAKTPDAPAVSK